MRGDVKLLTPKDVGRILGFRPRTITRWCREGVFPDARKVGRVWRIREDDDRLRRLTKVKALRDRQL